jgi:hypothetical protein
VPAALLNAQHKLPPGIASYSRLMTARMCSSARSWARSLGVIAANGASGHNLGGLRRRAVRPMTEAGVIRA